jgi:tRNA (guanine-N7-)-methyltransferase
MGKKKRIKYTASKELSNIIQPRILDFENFILESAFDRELFGNGNPVTVELGCGKGEFTIGFARKYPDRNFVGIDIKSDRMLTGARIAAEEGLSNVCFVRLRIECLAAYFPETFFSEGYITFPDPHESMENGKRRLTSKRFLDLYKRIFIPGSHLHLKTDSRVLYDFTLESVSVHGSQVIDHTDDLYGSEPETSDVTAIQTTYERRYLSENRTIKYIRFSI